MTKHARYGPYFTKKIDENGACPPSSVTLHECLQQHIHGSTVHSLLICLQQHSATTLEKVGMRQEAAVQACSRSLLNMMLCLSKDVKLGPSEDNIMSTYPTI